MRRLVLAGGGHAHLAVLQALAARPVPDTQVTLVTPYAEQTYSGMLPGWMAGLYDLSQCQIDLRPLAAQAGVELCLGEVVGLDTTHNRLQVRRRDAQQSMQSLAYDFVSLDIGSESVLDGLQAFPQLLPIRPLQAFLQQWPQILATAQQASAYQLAIVGGGAAGVELAFAAQAAFAQHAPQAQVHLVAPTLLAGHAVAVVQRVHQALQQRGVRWYAAQAQGVASGLRLDSGELLALDQVVAATGARPASWLATTDLKRDADGYIQVSAEHQSVSHANVFAAGDVCARDNPRFGRSGVHAVHAGDALAHNLLACLRGEIVLEAYEPKPRSLYLLATGDRRAIMSWGRWSAAGGWVWRWKDWLDRGFMRKHGVS